MRLLKAIGLVALIWGCIAVICVISLLLYSWGARHYGWWFPPAVVVFIWFAACVAWAYDGIE